MSDSVKRITVEYIDLEDRIRLTTATSEVPSGLIWLTQRLLSRLVPVIVQKLDQPARDVHILEAMQSFAQQAAAAELVPEVPVVMALPTKGFLAHSVDVMQFETGIRLTFRNRGEQSETVVMEVKQLRQLLGIIHGLYLNAGWPTDVWPGWFKSGAQANAGHAMVLH